MHVKVPTDGGWLGIADGESFDGFIDWTGAFTPAWELLSKQMAEHRALFWEAANIEAANWSVQVDLGAAPPKGARSVTGGLRLPSGKLCVFGWDQLTVVMQDRDETLLSQCEGHALLELPVGDYAVTVTQLIAADALEASDEACYTPSSPHFHISLAPSKQLPPAWPGVMWLSDRWRD